MATGKTHHVLCVACGIAATTLYAYPERRCGVECMIINFGITKHLTCTNNMGDPACGRGEHYDKFVQADFIVVPKLSSGQTGETRRA